LGSLSGRWVDSLHGGTCRASEALDLVPATLRRAVCDLPHASSARLVATTAAGSLPRPPTNAMLAWFGEATSLASAAAAAAHSTYLRLSSEAGVAASAWHAPLCGHPPAPTRCTTTIKTASGSATSGSAPRQPLLAFSAGGELLKLADPSVIPAARPGATGSPSDSSVGADGGSDERGFVGHGRKHVHAVDALAEALGCPTLWLLQVSGAGAAGEGGAGVSDGDAVDAPAAALPHRVIIPASAAATLHAQFLKVRQLWAGATASTCADLLDAQLSHLHAAMHTLLLASGASTRQPIIPAEALVACAITAFYQAAEVSRAGDGAEVSPIAAPAVAALLEAGVLLLGRQLGIVTSSAGHGGGGGGGSGSGTGSASGGSSTSSASFTGSGGGGFGGAMYQVAMDAVARRLVLTEHSTAAAAELEAEDDFAEDARLEETAATCNYLHMLAALAATLDRLQRPWSDGDAASHPSAAAVTSSAPAQRARSLAIASGVLLLSALRTSACRYWAAQPDFAFGIRGSAGGGDTWTAKSHLPPLAAPSWRLNQRDVTEEHDRMRTQQYYHVLATLLPRLLSHAAAAVVAAAPDMCTYAAAVADDNSRAQASVHGSAHAAGTLFMNGCALLMRCLDVGSEYVLYARWCATEGTAPVELPDIASRVDWVGVTEACAAMASVFTAATQASAMALQRHQGTWLAHLRVFTDVLAPRAQQMAGLRAAAPGAAAAAASQGPTASEARAHLSALTADDAVVPDAVAAHVDACDGWASMALRTWERVATAVLSSDRGVASVVASGALASVRGCALFAVMEAVLTQRVAAGLETYPYAGASGAEEATLLAPTAALQADRVAASASGPRTTAWEAANPLTAAATVLGELKLARSLAFAASPYGTGPTHHRGYTCHRPPQRCTRHALWCDAVRLVAGLLRASHTLALSRRAPPSPPGPSATPTPSQCLSAARDAALDMVFARRVSLHTAITHRQGVTLGFAPDLRKAVDVTTGLTFAAVSESAAACTLLSTLFITTAPAGEMSPFAAFLMHSGSDAAAVTALTAPSDIAARPYAHYLSTISTLAQHLVRDVAVLLGSGRGGKHPTVAVLLDEDALPGDYGGGGRGVDAPAGVPAMPGRAPTMLLSSSTAAVREDMHGGGGGSVVSDRVRTVSSRTTSTRRMGRINERDAGEAAREVLQGYPFNLQVVELSRDERAMAMRREAAARLRAHVKKHRFLALFDGGGGGGGSGGTVGGADKGKAAAGMPTSKPVLVGSTAPVAKTASFGAVTEASAVAASSVAPAGHKERLPLKSSLKPSSGAPPSPPSLPERPPSRTALRAAATSTAGLSSAGVSSFGGVAPPGGLYKLRRGRVHVPGAVAIESSADMLEAALFPALTEALRLAVGVTTALLHAAKLASVAAPAPAPAAHPALRSTVLAPVARAASAPLPPHNASASPPRQQDENMSPDPRPSPIPQPSPSLRVGSSFALSTLATRASAVPIRQRSDTLSTGRSFSTPVFFPSAHGAFGHPLAAWWRSAEGVVQQARVTAAGAVEVQRAATQAIEQEAAKASRLTLADVARGAWERTMAALEAGRGVRAVLPFSQPQAVNLSVAAAADKLLGARPAIAHLLQAISFMQSRFHRITAGMGVSLYDLPDDFDFSAPLQGVGSQVTATRPTTAALWRLTSAASDVLAERMFHIAHAGNAIPPITTSALREATRLAVYLVASGVDGAVRHPRLDASELTSLARDVRFVIGDAGLGHFLHSIADSPDEIFAPPSAAGSGMDGPLSRSPTYPRGRRGSHSGSREPSASSPHLHPTPSFVSANAPVPGGGGGGVGGGGGLAPTTSLRTGRSASRSVSGVGHVRKRSDSGGASLITAHTHRTAAELRREVADSYAATRGIAWLMGPQRQDDIAFLRVMAISLCTGLSARLSGADDWVGELLGRVAAAAAASASTAPASGAVGAGAGGVLGATGSATSSAAWGSGGKRLRATASGVSAATGASGGLAALSRSASAAAKWGW